MDFFFCRIFVIIESRKGVLKRFTKVADEEFRDC